jgi:squalene-hopene/tetraprenyl-beta-curcumene cyclase
LLAFQNHDGGWPTFCRGWGKLPFDRSGADLTAHALRAFKCWTSVAAGEQFERSVQAGFRYLARQQRPNGGWVPLWFGNQNDPHEENPVYGTAKVLLAYRDWGRLGTEPALRAIAWLCQAQNTDGGWGGDGQRSGVEETALAVEALVGVQHNGQRGVAFERGLRWLIEAVEANRHRDASPIGFYFAKLWYYEELYPLLFTLAALGQARRAATG